jgi:hypothetical protein
MRTGNVPGTKVPRARLDAIVSEIFDLMNAPNLFAHLAGEVSTQDLELRLQELLQERSKYETLELAMYLRASFVASDKCPSWQPLLNAAVEQGRMRGEAVWDIFGGMIPYEAPPQPNVKR